MGEPEEGTEALTSSEFGAARASDPDTSPGAARWTRIALATWPYALLLAIGLFVLLPRLGAFGFWDPWEPKYAESVREMIARDSYIVPFYRDEVRLTKPILVYWGILVGAALFGLDEFGSRIVGVGMAIGTMLTVFYGVSLLRGRRAGLLAALVLGTMPLFYFVARQATPDVYLFTSLGCGVLLFCTGLFGPARRSDLRFGASYACFALAVLAKGPVIAGVVFFGPLAVYTLARTDLARLWARDVRPGTLRLLLVGLPALLLALVLAALAFIFGTSPEWWGYSAQSRAGLGEKRQHFLDIAERLHLADGLLALLILGAAWALVSLLRRPLAGRRAQRTSMLFAAAVAAAAGATLALAGPTLKIQLASLQGLIACLAMLALVVWHWLRQPALRELARPFVRPVARQLGLFAVVFLVVAGPWHLAVFVQQSNGYFSDFILKHNVNRFTEEINQGGASYFYIQKTILYGLFPWSCFLPAALASLVGWSHRNPLKRYNLECYMLIAAVVTYASFSSSMTKFSYYLAPILVPVAIIIGLSLDRLLADRDARAFGLAAMVAALLSVPVLVDLLEEGGARYLIGSYTVKREIPEAVEPGLGYRLQLYAIAGWLFLLGIVRSRILFAGLVLSSVVFAHYSTTVLVPSISPHKSMKLLCETWKAQGAGAPLYFFGKVKHGVYFYCDPSAEFITQQNAFMESMNPASQAMCIVEREHIPKLSRDFRLKYPGQDLRVVNASHWDYHLVANYPALK